MGQPCAVTDSVHFSKRIGEEGVEKILKHSIELHGKDAKDNHVSVDTTVQEKSITYPTDAKLHKKIVDSCISIANQEGINTNLIIKNVIKSIKSIEVGI